MGLASANQSVNGVITAMMITASLELNLRLTANSRKMPMQNSVADIATDRPSAAISGSCTPSCMAYR